MGIYLNPGAKKLQQAKNGKIYIDKSAIIAYLNEVIDTEQRFVCVSRPRRFGKSMAATMVGAYYDRTVDIKAMFGNMNISKSPDFEAYAGKYDVIRINMQDFLSRTADMKELIDRLKTVLLHDLLREYPDYDYFDKSDFMETVQDIYQNTQRQFVILIDEWDCVFREKKNHKEEQDMYLDFLRDWLKDKEYVALAYMTGILPIKKYGTHSALNMFSEFSMVDQGPLAEFTGFTESEVKALCTTFQMDFEKTKEWYDGYYFDECGSIYSPRSVVQSMLLHKFNSYWNQTETFEALQAYINMNYDGLRDAVIKLVAGARQKINPGTFANDMVTFNSMDDVLTLLVHLGYLAYDFDSETVRVPNQEVAREFINATDDKNQWAEIVRAVKASDDILQAVMEGDAEAVAHGMETAHLETSHIQYNNENALSYTVSLALYAARKSYTVHRELPTGKGFADMVFIPRKNSPEKPALVVELKWNHDADTAIKQIKDKDYPAALEEYKGNMLLVGISYDKETRKHRCVIEKA